MGAGDWAIAVESLERAGPDPDRPTCGPGDSVVPSHLCFAPSPIVRSAHSVAPSHLQSLFEVSHGVGCQIRTQAGHGAAHSRHLP